MNCIPADYMQRLYAGWLAKVIGIRLGAPVEGWTYERIRDTYGELTGYPVDYSNFAADDDSNGPLFLLRALLHKPEERPLHATDVGDALLNYAPYEHGFFWWGGYGVSTEHTAYLNLRSGIPAPRSGSMQQNGAAVAEQIGGQIFIDTWGLVAPGNPSLAAQLAGKAASVTHDGNGVYGGIFIAVCISLAFTERSIRAVLDKALQYIPDDCEYARVVREVMRYHSRHPESWRSCYAFIHQHFGYDRYPGNCHIIPNAAVIILALLYGKEDFSDTLNICNMCGWDTDCNVGNVATIMGVLLGIEQIDYERWIKPTRDLLICSSVIGSLNSVDIPFCASFIAKMAYELAGEPIPPPFHGILDKRIHSAHFEYPKSTHAMRVRADADGEAQQLSYSLINTDESAHTGKRSLKLNVEALPAGQQVCLYQKTYYRPADFDDSRYDPSFSPTLYPGQRVTAAAMIPAHARPCHARLYVKNLRTGERILGERRWLESDGRWACFALQLPRMEGALLGEAGFFFEPAEGNQAGFVVLMDDLSFEGAADYLIDFAREEQEVWSGLRIETSQMTRLKGILSLEGKQLNLSCADFGEAYTGHYQWADYRASFRLCPVAGEQLTVNFRVQGAIRSYAFGFNGAGRLALLKNCNGYRELAACPFEWRHGQEYQFDIEVRGNVLKARCGQAELTAIDEQEPYLTGQVGYSVREGSRLSSSMLELRPL